MQRWHKTLLVLMAISESFHTRMSVNKFHNKKNKEPIISLSVCSALQVMCILWKEAVSDNHPLQIMQKISSSSKLSKCSVWISIGFVMPYFSLGKPYLICKEISPHFIPPTKKLREMLDWDKVLNWWAFTVAIGIYY